MRWNRAKMNMESLYIMSCFASFLWTEIRLEWHNNMLFQIWIYLLFRYKVKQKDSLLLDPSWHLGTNNYAWMSCFFYSTIFLISFGSAASCLYVVVIWELIVVSKLVQMMRRSRIVTSLFLFCFDALAHILLILFLQLGFFKLTKWIFSCTESIRFEVVVVVLKIWENNVVFMPCGKNLCNRNLLPFHLG